MEQVQFSVTIERVRLCVTGCPSRVSNGIESEANREQREFEPQAYLATTTSRRSAQASLATADTK